MRVYNRALSAGRDPERHGPQRHARHDAADGDAKTPATGAAGINVGTSATATFSEPMTRGTITAHDVPAEGRDEQRSCPATVTYDASHQHRDADAAGRARVRRDLHVDRQGRRRRRDGLAGNTLAADVSWSFSTEASPPPVLVVGSAANPFGSYLGEILRNEGLDAFTTIDASFLSPAVLSRFDVVAARRHAADAEQVTTLTTGSTAAAT